MARQHINCDPRTRSFGPNPKAYYWPEASGDGDTILGMLNLVTRSAAEPRANFNDQIATVSTTAAKARALGERPTIPIDPEQATDS